MSKLYYALSLWTDEVRLHDPSLYLPALPEHYEPNLLARIFNKQSHMWLEYLDTQRIQYNLSVAVTSAEQLEALKHLKAFKTTVSSGGYVRKSSISSNNNISNETLFFALTDRLVLKLPATSDLNLKFQSPLLEKYGEVIDRFLDIESILNSKSSQHQQTRRGSSKSTSSSSSSSKDAEIQLVVNISDQLLKSVFKYNKEFINHSLNCMLKLDEKLCGKLLTNLWCNELCEKYVQVPCTSLLNPMHQCTRPAMVKFVYELATKRDQYREEIKENRYSHEKLIASFFDITVVNSQQQAVDGGEQMPFEVRNRFPHEDIVKSMVALNHLIKRLLKNSFSISQQLQSSTDDVI
jgi:hypothetical protein